MPSGRSRIDLRRLDDKGLRRAAVSLNKKTRAVVCWVVSGRGCHSGEDNQASSSSAAGRGLSVSPHPRAAAHSAPPALNPAVAAVGSWVTFDRACLLAAGVMSWTMNRRLRARAVRPDRADCPAPRQGDSDRAGREALALRVGRLGQADSPGRVRPARHALVGRKALAAHLARVDYPAAVGQGVHRDARVDCRAAAGQEVRRDDRVVFRAAASKAARLARVDYPDQAALAARLDREVFRAAVGQGVRRDVRVDCRAAAANKAARPDRADYPAAVGQEARRDDRVVCRAAVGQGVHRDVRVDCRAVAANKAARPDRVDYPAAVVCQAEHLGRADYPVQAALGASPVRRDDPAVCRVAVGQEVLQDAQVGCQVWLRGRPHGPVAALRAAAHERARCRERSADRRRVEPPRPAGLALLQSLAGSGPRAPAQHHRAPGPAQARPEAAALPHEPGPKPRRWSRCSRSTPSWTSWVSCASSSR